MTVELEEDFADVANFLQDDIVEDDSDDGLERRIEEEHAKFREAQERKRLEMKVYQQWSVPRLSSPEPAAQRKYAEESANAYKQKDLSKNQRRTFVPRPRSNISPKLAYLQPPRPMSAGSDNRMPGTASPVLQDIQEEDAPQVSSPPAIANGFGHLGDGIWGANAHGASPGPDLTSDPDQNFKGFAGPDLGIEAADRDLVWRGPDADVAGHLGILGSYAVTAGGEFVRAESAADPAVAAWLQDAADCAGVSAIGNSADFGAMSPNPVPASLEFPDMSMFGTGEFTINRTASYCSAVRPSTQANQYPRASSQMNSTFGTGTGMWLVQTQDDDGDSQEEEEAEEEEVVEEEGKIETGELRVSLPDQTFVKVVEESCGSGSEPSTRRVAGDRSLVQSSLKYSYGDDVFESVGSLQNSAAQLEVYQSQGSVENGNGVGVQACISSIAAKEADWKLGAANSQSLGGNGVLRKSELVKAIEAAFEDYDDIPVDDGSSDDEAPAAASSPVSSPVRADEKTVAEPAATGLSGPKLSTSGEECEPPADGGDDQLEAMGEDEVSTVQDEGLLAAHNLAIQLMNRDLHTLPSQAIAVAASNAPATRPHSARNSLGYHGILGLHNVQPETLSTAMSPTATQDGSLAHPPKPPKGRRPLSAPLAKDNVAGTLGLGRARISSAQPSLRSNTVNGERGHLMRQYSAGAEPSARSETVRSGSGYDYEPSSSPPGTLQPVRESEEMRSSQVQGGGSGSNQFQWTEWHAAFHDTGRKAGEIGGTKQGAGSIQEYSGRSADGGTGKVRVRPASAQHAYGRSASEALYPTIKPPRPFSAQIPSRKGPAPFQGNGAAAGGKAQDGLEAAGEKPVGFTACVPVEGQMVSVYVADTTKRIADANRLLAQLGRRQRYRLSLQGKNTEVELCDVGYESGVAEPQARLTLSQFLSVHKKLKISAERRAISPDHIHYGGTYNGSSRPPMDRQIVELPPPALVRSKSARSAMARPSPYASKNPQLKTAWGRSGSAASAYEPSDEGYKGRSLSSGGIAKVPVAQYPFTFEQIKARIAEAAKVCQDNALVMTGLRQ